MVTGQNHNFCNKKPHFSNNLYSREVTAWDFEFLRFWDFFLKTISRQSQSVTSHFFSENIEKIYVLIFEPGYFEKFKILFLYYFKNVKP